MILSTLCATVKMQTSVYCMGWLGGVSLRVFGRVDKIIVEQYGCKIYLF